jgi:hypothetical protein
MKKFVILLATVFLSGCTSSQIRVSCRIHPELNKEFQASVGQTMINKEVCGSQEQWHGLAGGGMVTVTECQTAELIYLGKSGDTIRMSYREYVKDMARPAYSMEVTYPAVVGKVTFRNTTFEITEITGNHIKYILVLTPTEKCERIYYY